MPALIALLPEIIQLAQAAPRIWGYITETVEGFRQTGQTPTAQQIAQLQSDLAAMLAELRQVESR